MPHDLLDEVAAFIAEAAPHPNDQIALAGAIALLSGICGRCYNTYTGAGLNQFILLLASTGMGKEAPAAGISKALHAVATNGGVPAATEFKGPSLVSPTGLIKWLDKHPSIVTIAGEFGYKLKAFASARISPNDEFLKATLLDLYGKSGAGSVFDPLAYSEREKQTSAIVSPSLTLLGESVPSVVYEAIGDGMVTSGLLPRFTVFEITGQRSPLNENPEQAPSPQLLQKLADLCGYALTLNRNNQAIRVQPDAEGRKLLSEFGQWVTDEINAHNSEVTKELWNRAHLKALKLATLRAVAQNYLNPVVTYTNALWATNLIAAQTKSLIAKFEAGEVGNEAGDLTAEENALIDIIAQYISKPFNDNYHGTAEMHRDYVISKSYIQNRCNVRKPFKAHGKQKKRAIDDTIQRLIESDLIASVDWKQMEAKYETKAKGFVVSNANFFLKRSGGF